MRALFVIILLAALFLSSGHATASPPSDVSAIDVARLHTQAAQGDVKAQSRLGLLFLKGEGVPKDYTTARQWFEKAAAQGDSEAQFKLGEMYHQGKGVMGDYVRAGEWYKKASEQGLAEAQTNLGMMYAYELGVQKDFVRAYMWLSLAVAHSTGDLQKNTNMYLDYVAGGMTPAQIAEAQRLAQQCQARKFKGC